MSGPTLQEQADAGRQRDEEHAAHLDRHGVADDGPTWAEFMYAAVEEGRRSQAWFDAWCERKGVEWDD